MHLNSDAKCLGAVCASLSVLIVIIMTTLCSDALKYDSDCIIKYVENKLTTCHGENVTQIYSNRSVDCFHNNDGLCSNQESIMQNCIDRIQVEVNDTWYPFFDCYPEGIKIKGCKTFAIYCGGCMTATIICICLFIMVVIFFACFVHYSRKSTYIHLQSINTDM